MSVQTIIESKLTQELSPVFLDIENQSHEHAGHAHGDVESHFKVVIATAAFEGKRMVARHQMVYKILAEEMNNPVHALVLQTLTQDEWQSR